MKTAKKKELHNMRKNGTQLRDQYLEELADIQELKGNKNRAAIIRNI